METICVTLQAGNRHYVKVDGGPRVQIPVGDFHRIWRMAEVLERRVMELDPPSPQPGKSQFVRFPLQYPLQAYLPKGCFKVRTKQGPRTITGQIGALSLTVGGAEALATMMGVSLEDIVTWASEGIPDGPPKILLIRLGEEFGLDLSRIPAMTRVDSMPQEAE